MNRISVLWVGLGILGLGLVFLLLSGDSGKVFGMEDERFGRLVTLGALGTVIAAGVLRSGNRLGDTARSLAIWVLLILAVVAGYEYRYELQDFASRVSGGMVPGSPLTAFDADGRATVTLSKRVDGHFEARLSINGKTINAMVDTGATTTTLTAEDAATAGYDTANLVFAIPVSTANGMARAARVTAEDISVGAISRRNMSMLVAEPDRLEQSLLGMSFISTLSAFELRGDRLILRD